MTADQQQPAPLAVECSSCGVRLRVRASDLGQERACPSCHQLVRIPDREAAQRAQRIALAKSEHSFRCKLCGTRMYANPTQVGRTLPCPDCHSPNVVPAPAAQPPPRPLVLEADDQTYRLQEDERDAAGEGAVSPTATVRVYCSACDAMMYAREDQIGKLIPCVDCGAAVLVRPQPKSKKPVVVAVDPAIDLEPPEERPEEPKSLDRFIRAGTEYADRVVAARPVPPKRPFCEGVYTFPFYLEVLPRWVALTMLAMVMVPFIQMGAEAKDIEMLVVIPLFVVFVVVGFILIFATSTMLMTILHFTAGGYNHIEDWPRVDFFERIIYVLYPAGATIVSTAPLAILFGWYSWQVSVAVQVLGLATLFPIAILSMLDSGSPAMPYSSLVWRSLRQLPREWCRFYLATIPGWLLIAAWSAVAIRWPNEWIVASLFVGLMFTWVVYFRLLGRLAWVLDQKMPDDPLQTDEDQEGPPPDR